ncbi:hypothetical protein [Actinokineospora bangkokensis]|nr:hypothetical protein [Actinokineospora bangkokensis]
MRGRGKVVGLTVLAAVVVGAAQAVVTNYATVEVPEFFKDQWRVWLVLAVLVLLVVIGALVQGGGGGAVEQPVIPRLSVLAPQSLRPPVGGVEMLRGRESSWQN